MQVRKAWARLVAIDFWRVPHAHPGAPAQQLPQHVRDFLTHYEVRRAPPPPVRAANCSVLPHSGDSVRSGAFTSAAGGGAATHDDERGLPAASDAAADERGAPAASAAAAAAVASAAASAAADERGAPAASAADARGVPARAQSSCGTNYIGSCKVLDGTMVEATAGSYAQAVEAGAHIQQQVSGDLVGYGWAFCLITAGIIEQQVSGDLVG